MSRNNGQVTPMPAWTVGTLDSPSGEQCIFTAIRDQNGNEVCRCFSDRLQNLALLVRLPDILNALARLRYSRICMNTATMGSDYEILEDTKALLNELGIRYHA